MPHAQRLALAGQLEAEVRAHYGERVLATGAYGSLARGDDGPYSDIEMHCIVRGEGIETSHEWSAGPWKAEVDVYSLDVVLRAAAELDGPWAMTHGAFVTVLPFYDPHGLFPQLAAAALNHADAEVNAVLHDLVVGEIYELIGKLRNACAAGEQAPLAYYAVGLARHGACLIGLANRRLFTTSARWFPEALALPGRPAGYDDLCALVTSGDLGDADRLAQAANGFWLGLETWCSARGLVIERSLGELLTNAATIE